MNFLTKSGIALAVLAGAGLSGAAQAQNLTVAEATTGGYLYTYSVTPAFDSTSLSFAFKDTNVSYVSETGPLNQEFGTMGSFFVYSFTGPVLTGGTTETVVFSSPDAPGSFVNVTSIGTSGTGKLNNVLGPAAVPEASTTVSFGLLLMLGLGGLAFAARRKGAQTSV